METTNPKVKAVRRPISEEEAAREAAPVAQPLVDSGSLRNKNIAFMFAMLLLWVAARFLFIRMQKGSAGDFMKYDVLFILLPAVLAFFMNWYWMREQRTDRVIKWSIGWAAVDLVFFMLLAFFAAAPLHGFLMSLNTNM